MPNHILNDADYAEFERIIKECWNEEIPLPDVTSAFVGDLARRYEMYGRKTFVTQGQLNRLREIAKELGSSRE